jgi:hypothetical protein
MLRHLNASFELIFKVPRPKAGMEFPSPRVLMGILNPLDDDNP